HSFIVRGDGHFRAVVQRIVAMAPKEGKNDNLSLLTQGVFGDALGTGDKEQKTESTRGHGATLAPCSYGNENDGVYAHDKFFERISSTRLAARSRPGKEFSMFCVVSNCQSKYLPAPAGARQVVGIDINGEEIAMARRTLAERRPDCLPAVEFALVRT